ncbi:MAG: hypothetical protein E7607_05475 [Ruminococcaceae bacterium]|jgi:hypothetical protein|nr:hypothetical protein [Oscillospiraceae bacterium]
MFFRKKKTNYGKIIAISLACIAVVGVIAFIIYKLVKRYTEDLVYECDDLLDECDECDVDADDDDVIEA